MKRFVFLFPALLLLLLLLILIPGCIRILAPAPNPISPSAAPPAPSASMPFAVTSVMANTEPSNSTHCFNLYANITANGPGTATYRWESADGGGYSYTWNAAFPTAGTQKITLPVEMSALPSGLYRVHILTPNDTVSNTTYYTTCAP